LVFFDGLAAKALGIGIERRMFKLGRAFRVTLLWQGLASAAVAAMGGGTAGGNGVLSALLGGMIGMAGVLVFGLMSARPAASSNAAVRVALRAEAAKVAVMVLLLWLVFAAYQSMVVLVFLGAFVVSVLLSGLAFAVSGD
jgi:ATP synthase protein I